MALEKLTKLSESPLRTTAYGAVFIGDDTSTQKTVRIHEFSEELRAHPQWEQMWDDAISGYPASIPSRMSISQADKTRGWVVTEYAEYDLATILKQRPLTVEEVLSILDHVLTGLEGLHAVGRIHGGICPAALLFQDAKHTRLDYSPGLTLAGEHVLPQTEFKYIAPEMYSPEVFGDIGPQSDLYALGFCCLELLAGSQFNDLCKVAGSNPEQLDTGWMAWHTSSTERLLARDISTPIPEPLARFLDRMTSKTVADRFPDAKTALAELPDHVNVPIPPVPIETGGGTGRPPPVNYLRTIVICASIIVVIGGLAAGLFAWGKFGPGFSLRETRVILEIDPPDAKVYVDDALQEATSPDGLKLAPGQYVLSIKRNGYVPYEDKITVPAAESLELDPITLKALPPEETKVSLSTEPVGAAIEVDGTRREGLVTPTTLNLPPGKHAIAYLLEGYQRFEQAIEVPGESRAVYRLKTVKLAVMIPPDVMVEIRSTPPGATLSIGEKELGPLDGKPISLPPGRHRLSLTLDGYLPYEADLDVPSSGTAFKPSPFVLEPAPPVRVVVENSLGMKLIKLDPGTYLRGAPDNDPNAADQERPQRKVEITKAFYLGETEVTVGQWERFIEASGYSTDAERSSEPVATGFDSVTKLFATDSRFNWRNTGWQQSPEHPVVNITINDAQSFCEWLTRTEKRRYRLPTEQEWEFACRSATETRYWFGDDGAALAEHENIADASLAAIVNKSDALPKSDGHIFSSPVRAFAEPGANPWGLHGMHGNVSEWCVDTATTDVPAVALAKDAEAVFRGGSWYSGPIAARSSARAVREGGNCFNHVGFRVAMEE